MKKILSYLTLAVAVLLSSCSALPNRDPELETGEKFIIIQGTVADMDNNMLEHIRITVTVNSENASQTYYTSSEGKFRCEVPSVMSNGQITINLLIEDIDGAQNGGSFGTISDVITIFEENYLKYPIMVDLPTFRLTHATVSVSNRQS